MVIIKIVISVEYCSAPSAGVNKAPWKANFKKKLTRVKKTLVAVDKLETGDKFKVFHIVILRRRQSENFSADLCNVGLKIKVSYIHFEISCKLKNVYQNSIAIL